MVDVLKGLIDYLRGDAAVAAIVSTRVFGLELPKAESASMPRNCVVLRVAGGIGNHGSRDYVALSEIRVDVLNYGISPIAAMTVQRATHDRLKAIDRDRQGDTLLHRANQSSGPNYFKDVDGDWPLVLETWMVLASETTAS